MEAGRLLRDARRRHRVNQRSLARRASTSQTYISRVERGEVIPTVESLDKFLRAMGERLQLNPVPGPRGNRSLEDLRADFERLSPEQRVAQAAELSYAMTSLSGAGGQSP